MTRRIDVEDRKIGRVKERPTSNNRLMKVEGRKIRRPCCYLKLGDQSPMVKLGSILTIYVKVCNYVTPLKI